MSKAIKTLLEIASNPLMPPLGHMDLGPFKGQLIADLLLKRNGFFSHESALLVRPLTSGLAPIGIIEWNAPELWKSKYDVDLASHTFFAENIFGEQYSLKQDRVYHFDPETGEAKCVAEDLSDWASMVLHKPDFHVGHSLAHAWQSKYRSLANGERLLPKQPFVLQGEFNVENLLAKSDVDGMIIRSKLANEIAKLPEGARIKFELI